MEEDLRIETQKPACNRVMQKAKYFVIGGGVGAVLALLFAPKPGREFRSDIADFANETMYGAVESASDLGHMVEDYFEQGKDITDQLVDVVATGGAEIAGEIRRDAKQIANIAARSRKHMSSRQVL